VIILRQLATALIGSSIIETHSKTSVVFVNFSITIAGWWTWNLLLALVYARSAGPYAVRDGFTKTFGGDPIWWLTLVIVFAILLVIQLTYKVCKRGCIRLRLWPLGNFGQISKEDFDEWNVNRWQELEQIQKVKGEL
jgi:phospholipid-translocating ATPase